MIKLIAFDLLGVLVRKRATAPASIMEKIKTDYPDILLAIATNYDKSIRPKLEGVYPLADLIISGEIGCLKPDKEYFQYILDKYKLKAHEVLFLDDSAINVASAKEMGFETIQIFETSDLLNEIYGVLSKKGWHAKKPVI